MRAPLSLVHDQTAFHNVAALEETRGGGLRLQRFPEAIRNQFGFKAHSRGRFFAERAAGCEIRFVTAGPFVRVRLMAVERDARVVVYRGDHAHSAHDLPAGRVTALFLEDPPFFAQVDPESLKGGRFAPSVWRLVFDQDAVVEYIGTEGLGHATRPPASDEVPAVRLLAYGSSITFGANVFFPPNAYVLRAARLLGVDVFNKGLPGSCLCEPGTAEWLARLDWDAAFLELGVNMLESATVEEFAERAGHLVRTLHAADTQRQIFVTGVYPNRGLHLRDAAAPDAGKMAAFNEATRAIVGAISAASVRFLEPGKFLRYPAGLHTDLLHPDDDGHLTMASALADALKPHLSRTPL